MRNCALVVVLIAVTGLPLATATDDLELDRQIQRWISDWDQTSFSVRNEASRKLRDAGTNAFPALVAATRHGTPETISRALEILKSALNADDASFKAAARKSLDEIAASPHALAARSAKQTLHNFDHPPSQVAINGRPMGFPGQFGFPVQPNFARRINTSVRNGTTTIEAFENDARIKIQTDVTGRIKVEITPKKPGIEITNRFEAANLRELKVKHPLAHQVYQKYETTLQQTRLIAQRGIGGGNIGGGNIGGGIQIPGQIPGMPNFALPADGRQQALRAQDRQIESLQRLVAGAPSREAADMLKRNLQRVIESRNQLQRELDRNR